MKFVYCGETFSVQSRISEKFYDNGSFVWESFSIA